MNFMNDAEVKISLLTKPECHLCTDARTVLEEITAEYGLGWEELSATDHPELGQQFAEEIPVLFVNDKQRDFWRIDPVRLRRLIEQHGGTPRA